MDGLNSLCARAALAALLLLGAAGAAAADEKLLAPSTAAAGLDRQIDWSRARLIAVQDAGRYKTLDSFARESMQAMHGREHLPGLSPMASLFEWLFRSSAYADEPVIYIKDRGLRIHFGVHRPAVERQYLRDKGYMTPRQLADSRVQQQISELEPRFEMVTAMRRVRHAEAVAFGLDRMLNIVPPATSDPKEPWHRPEELNANLPAEYRSASAGGRGAGQPVSGITEQQALTLMAQWAGLREAWQRGDAAGVQRNLDALAAVLPTLAAPNVYPSHAQRAAEARYYAMGKFTWGWVIYFLGGLAAFWALVTGWRVPWWLAIVLVTAGLVLHAYGLALRWYILGRIPVANMFEAVVASAWLGIAAALLAELKWRTRVFVLAAAATGFMALILGAFVIPGGGTLTTIMGILDDVMLRIHTVLIIASYALIFVASVIALVYLFTYYYIEYRQEACQFGVAAVFAGLLLIAASTALFESAGPLGVAKRAGVAPIAFGLSAALATAIGMLIWMRAGGRVLAFCGLLLVTAFTIGVGDAGFTRGVGLAALGCGAVLAAVNGVALLMRGARSLAPAAASPALALAGGAIAATPLRLERPLLAGGAPGDEHSVRRLPHWLHQVDWSHLIILNMVFVMLFVGIILGAVWADYSWGRPWGWDPKEVFAMNTWIIYAILMHVRFAVKDRGLWTAWLSVAGCLMMAFNWCFVNFFIVGLHSYA